MGRNTIAHVCHIYSDELAVMCREFEHSPFTFSKLSSICSTYDHSTHLRMIRRGLIKQTNRIESVRYYRPSIELIEWYHRNYVTCNGKGKIAKENRRIKRESILNCASNY